MLACKCLNVTINTKSLEIPDADLESLSLSLPLSATERNDSFFKEDLGKADVISISKEQACLVQVRNYVSWIIHRCINCNMDTHALHRDRGAACVLISRKMLTDVAAISALKNSASFSPVFRIVVNSSVDTGLTANSDIDHLLLTATPTAVTGLGSVHTTLAALQQQLTEAIQREAQQVEERVRLFSEQQYTQLEEFGQKAHEDHRTLSRLLVEAKNNENLASLQTPPSTPEYNSKSSIVTSLASSLASAPLPDLPLPPNMPVEDTRQPMATLSQNNKRLPTSSLSSQLNSSRKSISPSEPRPVPSIHVRQSQQPQPALSADCEGLFMLDGMDENPPGTFPSEDETDTDESGSHDEGIHIPRGSTRVGQPNLAQSLPVSVPAFPGERSHGDDIEEESLLPQDPMDIAASIKALARSVHGDTVFGDLPRPRFSSQI